MRTGLTIAVVCAVLVGVAKSAAPVASNGPSSASRATPLILEQSEGERRAWRPIEGAKGWDAVPGPFILKVDRRSGGSSHLVFVTEDVPPGAAIDRHRHPGADEIIFLQNGRARVRLGNRTKEVPLPLKKSLGYSLLRLAMLRAHAACRSLRVRPALPAKLHTGRSPPRGTRSYRP